MAYFNIKERKIEPRPIPPIPPYIPPVPPTPPIPEEGSTPDIPRGPFVGDTQIIFYKTSDDENTMYKTLTDSYSVNGAFKDDVDILNPAFPIEADIKLSDYNYVYISQFNRFYYAKIDYLTGKRYAVNCRVDALMSLKEQVQNIPCIIDREQPTNDLYINGGTFVQGVKNYSKSYNFNNGFNSTPQNILICCGGE